MKQILLLRHGKTKGNLEGRYIGARTDEPLCQDGISHLLQRKESLQKELSFVQMVYVSPMQRAIQTAEILFPGIKPMPLEQLKEIDFGDFENKNYEELNGNADYQKWIDQGGKSDYPGGEGYNAFIQRSMHGFRKVLIDMEQRNLHSAGVVCHGGNIMSVMSILSGKDYFDFQIGNAEGFLLEIETKEQEIDLVSYRRI
ncbi:MAG: histidine phosphatase family protein [Lachnospiraceae bacterium]|nr:histidine phosphatase family protein [Lachnospiraceae bacterium]